MTPVTYKTIAAPQQCKFTEKASKFLGFVFPVQTEEEIKNHLQHLRKEYHDASHVCFAWRLGNTGERYRSSDDGEPSGTAGKPILAQLDALQVTYTLVAVVRYFGGTKLGTGGLIQAYREAARMALEICTVVEKDILHHYNITCPYRQHAEFMQIINQAKITLVNEHSDEDYHALIAVPAKYNVVFLQWVTQTGVTTQALTT
jgi:uncharacterized YigZ family protein